MVHLVFYQSFNGRHNKDRDQFLREKRSDQSLARLVIWKIFHSQLVTKWRLLYLQKTYLWLSDVLFEISLSHNSHKFALKPRRRSLLSEKLTMKHSVHHLVRLYERKLPTVANQNSRKNRKKGSTNKKLFYIFLQKWRHRTRVVSGVRRRYLTTRRLI